MRRRIAKAGRCPKTGKVRFRDELSAKTSMSHVAEMSDRERVPVRVYQCEFCLDWHMTSREERPR